ncbi:MAG: hypothetical protein AAFO69_06615 [Bacteroidota bacterium]
MKNLFKISAFALLIFVAASCSNNELDEINVKSLENIEQQQSDTEKEGDGSIPPGQN